MLLWLRCRLSRPMSGSSMERAPLTVMKMTAFTAQMARKSRRAASRRHALRRAGLQYMPRLA